MLTAIHAQRHGRQLGEWVLLKLIAFQRYHLVNSEMETIISIRFNLDISGGPAESGIGG